ncbi:hypothetical protein GCM10009665_23190 [Kitasatospora nipponensis]|uniref:Uncharacterized protein n=1 Tax=Kitasatospora nipponensis TaxID=258049 RepID=A0ABN1W3N0_9ACTN
MTHQTNAWRPISDAIAEPSAIRPLPVRSPGTHRPDPEPTAAGCDFFTARTAATPRRYRDLPHAGTVQPEPERA